MRTWMLGFLAGLGWAVSSCSDPVVTTAPPEVGASKGLEVGDPGIALADPGEERPVVDAEGTSSDRSAVPSDSQFEYDGTRVVNGRVAFPEGTPDDERCQVVLWCTAPLEEPEAEGETESWARAIMLTSPRFEEVVRIDVGPEGHFELEVPSNTDVYRIAVRGRYVHAYGRIVREDQEMSFDEPIVVQPSLGSWVTFRLVPPADTAHDPTVLIGRELRLDDHAEGFRDPLTAEIDGTLRAEFKGLAVPGPRSFGYSVERNRVVNGEATHLAPFVAVMDRIREFEPGKRIELEVPLEDGLYLTGDVVDESGAVVGGARVVARCERGGSASEYHATTDGRGGFAFQAISSALASLEAKPAGYDRVVLRGDALGVGNRRSGLRLVLSRGLGIAGVLRFEDGRPVQSASVTASPRDAGEFSTGYTAKTDAEGAFRITGIPEGRFNVQARGSFDPSLQGAPLRRPLPAGAVALRADQEGVEAGTSTVELVMGPGHSVGVSVVDETGARVDTYTVGARHLVYDPEDSFLGSRRAGTRISVQGDSGVQSLGGLAAGRHVIWVQHDDNARSEDRLVTVLDDSTTLEFVLPNLGSLAGRVHGAAFDGSVGVRLFHFVDGIRWNRDRRRVEGNGSFRFDRLTYGTYEFEIEGGGLLATEPWRVELPPGGSREDLEFEVLRGGSVECTLRLADGTPAVGASVTAHRESDGRSLVSRRSDGDGVARLEPLPPGRIEIRASLRAAGQRESEVLTEVVTLDSGGALTLSIQGTQGTIQRPPTATLSGHITGGAKGAELDRMGVRAVPIGEGGTEAYDQVSSSGSFVLDDVEPGTYELRADPLRFSAWAGFGRNPMGEKPGAGRGVFGPIVVVAGSEIDGLEIELQPVGRIRGRIVDMDGRPVAEAWVLAVSPERDRREHGVVKTDLDGRFLIEDRSPGSWWVRAHSESGVTAEPIRVEVEGSGETEFEEPIVLRAGTKLTVTLVNAFFESLDPPFGDLSSVEIRILDEGGIDRGEPWPRRRSAVPSNVRVFAPLLPGRYRLQGMDGDRVLIVEPLELTGEPSLDVTLGD